MPYHTFGGVTTMIRKGPIGKPSGNYVHQKNRGGMGFRDFHSFNLATLESSLRSRPVMCKGVESKLLFGWETSSGKDEKREFFHLAEYARGAGLL